MPQSPRAKRHLRGLIGQLPAATVAIEHLGKGEPWLAPSCAPVPFQRQG